MGTATDWDGDSLHLKEVGSEPPGKGTEFFSRIPSRLDLGRAEALEDGDRILFGLLSVQHRSELHRLPPLGRGRSSGRRSSGVVAEEKALKWGQSSSDAVFLDASKGLSGKGAEGDDRRHLMRAIEFSCFLGKGTESS